jgi:hypothetical protein
MTVLGSFGLILWRKYGKTEQVRNVVDSAEAQVPVFRRLLFGEAGPGAFRAEASAPSAHLGKSLSLQLSRSRSSPETTGSMA